MGGDRVVTTIVLSRETWRLLGRLAHLRAERLGGRPSQSAVVEELITAAPPPKVLKDERPS